MSDFDYNTQREDIKLKEYGRNVQRITDYIRTITDEDEKLQKAKTLVKLMKIINPSYKDNSETEQKAWDHLHIITDFELDFENAPFEKPLPEVVNKRPEKVPYHTERIKLKHYGKNIELIIDRIIEETDPEAQLAGISRVGKMMKKFYSDFNKDTLEDDVIASQIEHLSAGKIKVDLEKVTAHNLFYVPKADLLSNPSQNSSTSFVDNLPKKRKQQNNNMNSNNNNRKKSNNKNNRRK